MVDDSGRNGSTDSSGNNAFNPSESRAFRLQVEANLAERFVRAMELRLKQMEVKSAQDFKMSEHERKVLMNVVTTNLLEGAAAGVVTFVILRRLNAAYFKYLKRGYADEKAALKRQSVPNSFNSPYQQVPTNPQQSTNMTEAMGKSTEGSNGNVGFARWFVDATSLMFDGIVSIYVAIFVSTRNPGKFMKEVSDIPLMEGQSIVSRELCPILLSELQKIHADLAHDSRDMSKRTLPKISDKNKVVVREAITNPQSPILQCLMNFCTNCRRREAYEQILREESGSSIDTVISIPPTFDVTNDIAADTNSLSTVSTTTEDMFNDSSFDDDTNNGDWTEPFVTDQEDDRPKK